MALMKLHEYTAERGRKSQLAVTLGVPAQLVGQWANGVRPTPIDRAPAIERATLGSVAVEDLCPDATWSRVSDPLWPHPKGRPLLDLAAATAGEAV